MRIEQRILTHSGFFARKTQYGWMSATKTDSLELRAKTFGLKFVFVVFQGILGFCKGYLQTTGAAVGADIWEFILLYYIKLY